MHDDIQPGDYWRILDREAGEPMVSQNPRNLTGSCWFVVAPGGGEGYMIGRLQNHTVRENRDGTISVLPGDGSSNSIKITQGHVGEWHGYIREGVWETA